MKRLPMLLSLLALIALSISITYWVLQWTQPAQREQAAAPMAALPPPAIDAAATLFGGQASTAVASNYQLTGVVAAGRDSAAIIVTDGNPKAIKIGMEVASGVTVREVHPRYVMLSDAGVMKRIDLAQDSKSAGGGAPASPQPNQPPQPQFQQQPQPQPQPQPPPQQQPQQQPGQAAPIQMPQPQPQSAMPPPPPPSVQMAPPMRGQNPNTGPAQLQ